MSDNTVNKWHHNSDIPVDNKYYLNTGVAESKNVIEWLAVDHKALVCAVLTGPENKSYIEPCLNALNATEQKNITDTISVIGKTLFDESFHNGDKRLFPFIATHVSDSVRCWAAYYVGHENVYPTEQLFESIMPFVTDKHFGVREIACMALRLCVERELPSSIEILKEWSTDDDLKIRRCACEVVRPLGIWNKPIPELIEDPAPALAIVNNLKNDPEKSVQESVINWLTDVGNTHNQWVLDLCTQWEITAPSKAVKVTINKVYKTLKRNSKFLKPKAKK